MASTTAPKRRFHDPWRTVGVLALALGGLALAGGLYVHGAQRDAVVERVAASAGEVAAAVAADAQGTIGADVRGRLAAAVLGVGDLRAATLVAGDTEVTVGSTAPVGPAEPGSPVVVEEPDGPVARATVPVPGSDASLRVEALVGAPSLTWGTIGLTWFVVVSTIVVVVMALERRRRDRIATLEETVRAFNARDAHVSADLQDLARAKVDFITAISHEFRTPLQVITGLAELLAHRGADLGAGRVGEISEGLLSNARRLDTLLRDLLDVDRLTNRTVAVVRRPVDLGEALDAALAAIAITDHELERDVEGVVAQATGAHVERILQHLLHNAVKYTPAGTTITVRASRRDGAVELVVEDEGPGVPASERLRVFEPLQRVSDDRADPGAGLGLALVKRFTELHGGRTWVDDAPGGGASFHVLIPDEGDAVRVDAWTLPTAVDDRPGKT